MPGKERSFPADEIEDSEYLSVTASGAPGLDPWDQELFGGQNDKLEAFNRTVGRIRLHPRSVKLRALLRKLLDGFARDDAKLFVSVYLH